MHYLYHKFNSGVNQRTAAFFTYEYLSSVADVNFWIYYNVNDSDIKRLPVIMNVNNDLMLFPERYTSLDLKKHYTPDFYEDNSSLAVAIEFPDKDFKYIEPMSPQDIMNPKYDNKPYFELNDRNTKNIDDTLHEERFLKIKNHLISKYEAIINTPRLADYFYKKK